MSPHTTPSAAFPLGTISLMLFLMCYSTQGVLSILEIEGYEHLIRAGYIVTAGVATVAGALSLIAIWRES